MDEYLSLKKLSYQGLGADEGEFRRRIDSPSCVTLKFPVGNYSMFYVVTASMMSKVEEISQMASEIQKYTNLLPDIVMKRYIRLLIADETVATNDIEGINSTRKEALAAYDADENVNIRLSSLVHLLASLTTDLAELPLRTPADIRAIYDAVTRGEVDGSDAPDGELFRAQPVHVIAASQKVIHTGFQPERKIVEGLEVMLQELTQPSGSHVISAIISHLMFEIVHPFYDGNGRTGRFILARKLAERGWPITALSVSARINENKNAYYRQFADVEHPLNRGEATHFVLFFLDLILEAQRDALNQLDEAYNRLAIVQEHLKTFDVDTECFTILWILAQAALFSDGNAVERRDLERYVKKSTPTINRHINELVEGRWVEQVSQRPVAVRLTEKGMSSLNLR
ncbi:Fic family protein [Arcanobacterium phocisimile]|uniref:Fic family protein n=1 Tax=Arcanobacterium phocisimile TaxID=1302235 RepID=A0ABX7IF52_9ACTO|nr:Fic family protein [Arcanobacterium phocisimile]QRV01591.1 Fic family protein [Arcanobacterium phocisimile]